jgi:hypothetical protein
LDSADGFEVLGAPYAMHELTCRRSHRAIVLAVERNKYVTNRRHGSVLSFRVGRLLTSPTSSARAQSGHVAAAKRGYEFSPLDVDCHVTLP